MHSLPLTAKQLDVIDGIAEGLTDDAIARRMGICRSTVRQHMNYIRDKLGIQTGPNGNKDLRGKIIIRAFEEGYLKLTVVEG